MYIGSRCWLVVVFGLVLSPVFAYGDVKFDEGRWRLELSGARGIHSGSTDREGDTLVTGSVEYEFPASARTTLGLRLLPLFIYDQDDYETVVGGGFGLSGRLYQHAAEYRGWFGELGVSALAHDGKIRRNSSNVNFLTGVGVGYQFKSNWHATLRYEHLSNAGLGDHNAGVNTVGLAFGFTF
ncbi:MAG TPA: acyloxyacyl hydrolase [Candidatus Hydrogenedentes bacterium]|nr:acyloxyacyl hydrolase [Candidatus Hydrogenedentota bacterium]